MSAFGSMSLMTIEKEAASYHCEVIIAADNELQFDLDTVSAEKQFAEFYMKKLFNRYGDKLPRETWMSKNGNTHWVITLPKPLTVVERIALQTQGGSDPGREFAALCCHWDGSPHPILLFKPLPKTLAPAIKFTGPDSFGIESLL
jgi:hypothetical protein